jgi:hypothetical protein
MTTHYQLMLLAVALIVSLMYWIFHPINRSKNRLIDHLTTIKTQTVNMLNTVLKTDTTKLVDYHVPDVHCDGVVDHVMSPDELLKLVQTNPTLYNKLVSCGYTRTVGLLHGLALWSSTSKTKDLSSFNYFVKCINSIEWKNPALFVNFHSPASIVGKCIM